MAELRVGPRVEGRCPAGPELRGARPRRLQRLLRLQAPPEPGEREPGERSGNRARGGGKRELS